MAWPLILAAAGLGGLGSWLTGRSQAQSAEENYRRYLAMLRYYNDPNRLKSIASGYYQDWLGSPSYLAGQQALYGGAQNVGNQYARSAGESGVRSGVGAVAGGLANSAYGFALPQFLQMGQEQANQMAREWANRGMQGLAGLPQVPSSNMLGETLGAFGGALSQYALYKALNETPGVKVTQQDPGWASRVPSPTPDWGSYPVNPPEGSGSLMNSNLLRSRLLDPYLAMRYRNTLLRTGMVGAY